MVKDCKKLEDERVSYLAKEDYLRSQYMQVSPTDFYRDLFPKGLLQSFGDESDGKGCAIVRFEPDKSTWKTMRARLEKSYKDEVFRDCDSVMQYFRDLFDPLPVDVVPELEKRLDDLDKRFHAGKYLEKGKPIRLTYYNDKVTGKEKYAKFDQRIHDDLNELSEAIGKRTAYISPISYYGKKALGKNARYLYAIVLDIDGVGIQELKTLLAWFQHDMLPVPTYLVHSGHGVHLYFMLEEPEPLYAYARAPISKLKNELVKEYWTKRTSKFPDNIDDQPWGQLYRAVGSLSKLGTGYPATAYKIGNYTTLEALNEYLEPEQRIQLPLDSYRPHGKSGHDIEYWKNENPNWYKRVILKKTPDCTFDARYLLDYTKRNRVTAKEGEDLYKFPWLYTSLQKKVFKGARIGNRYHCACVLFADAAKCGIPYQVVYDWLKENIDYFNFGVEAEKDLFTQDDIDCAVRYYNKEFADWLTLERLRGLTGFKFTPNKRNGRDQETHLQKYIPAMRSIGAVKDTRFGAKDGNQINKDGRPSAEQTVRDYLQEHPDARKVDVVRGTGLTKPTVYKWYDKIKKVVNPNEKDKGIEI